MSILLLSTPTMRLADELGPVLAGRGEAAELRERVEQLAATADPVVIDFEGVLAVSPSWADEFFAKLDPELVAAGRIEFTHISGSLAAIARYVKDGRGPALAAGPSVRARRVRG